MFLNFLIFSFFKQDENYIQKHFVIMTRINNVS